MISILTILATLPSGRRGPPLTFDELGKYLAQHCATDEDKDRNARHALREQLYRDGGVQWMTSWIDTVFRDDRTRELRKQWVKLAGFNNVLRRIVHELSTVYSEPARRSVTGDDNNARYHELLAAIRIDERMLEISRLLNLHRALLVGFRVRELPDGTRQPVIDIASPATARAVLHPNDSTLVVGWLIRASYRSARRTNLPAWTLWTDHECVQLRDDMSVIGDTYATHGLGVCPWVPVTLGPPAPGFWPGHEGEDLVRAHLSIWFNNVLLLKESKSATVQSVIQGDGATLARGQAADTEVPAELADGQTVTTVDLSMDLSMFRDTADHVLSHAGLNYGLPPAVLTHQGTQSAEARDLMRIPIRELRKQQQVPLRLFELQLARAMASVLAVDMPELAFDPTGWRIEFSESETPLDPVREHELFEKRRAAGLDNSVAFYQRLRPGISAEQAWAEIQQNILVETERNREMRPLQSISGSLRASVDPPAAKGGNDTPPSERQDNAPDPR